MSYLRKHPIGWIATALLLVVLGVGVGWSNRQTYASFSRPIAGTTTLKQAMLAPSPSAGTTVPSPSTGRAGWGPDSTSTRESAHAAQQQSLRDEIASLQAVLASSTSTPEAQTEARLRLAECHLDIVPGEEYLTIKYAQEILDSDAPEEAKIRAKLLMAESYRSWRYQALKLYTQILDEYPGTEWEAWAKVGMARTLAEPNLQFDPETEPPYQCEEAVRLLGEANVGCPGSAAARAARRLMPEVRAYFDFPKAVQDLQEIALELEPDELDDEVRQMVFMAVQGGATSTQVAQWLSETAEADTEPLGSVATRWIELLDTPLATANPELPVEESAILLRIHWIQCDTGSADGRHTQQALLSAIGLQLPGDQAVELWFELGMDAYRADDFEMAHQCLEEAKARYLSAEFSEVGPRAANHVAHLARLFEDWATVGDVLTDALNRWPHHAESDRTLAALARWHREKGDPATAEALYVSLLEEFPVSKQRQTNEKMINRLYPAKLLDSRSDSGSELATGGVL